MPGAKTADNRRKALHLLREIGQTVGIALVIVLATRAWVAESYWIPTVSMEPTLRVNDRFMARKLMYNLDRIKHGDIVVFYSPLEPHKKLIKRVIGLPNEEITIRHGQVYINGQPTRESYTKYVDESRRGFPRDDLGPIIVPAQMLFVMGDNRDNSYDSRFWGFLPAENVIGKALIRYWPLWRATVFP